MLSGHPTRLRMFPAATQLLNNDRVGMLDSDGFKSAPLEACPKIRWLDSDDDHCVYPSFGLGILAALVELLPLLLDPRPAWSSRRSRISCVCCG